MKIRLKCKLPDIVIDVPESTYDKARDEDHFSLMVAHHIDEALSQSDLWAVSPEDVKAVTKEFKRRKKQGRV